MGKIDLLKSEVFRLIYLDPILYIQNAFKNVLQLYGLGYLDDYYWFQYCSMAVGAAFLTLLIYNKLYFHIVLILTLNAGYILYFPPVPVYMAGTYLLWYMAGLRFCLKRVFFYGVIKLILKNILFLFKNTILKKYYKAVINSYPFPIIKPNMTF